MTLITIVTKDLLIENCYLEKQYDYLIALKKERFIIYTASLLHVCLQARRGHQISLWMVMSHHVVAGN